MLYVKHTIYNGKGRIKEHYSIEDNGEIKGTNQQLIAVVPTGMDSSDFLRNVADDYIYEITQKTLEAIGKTKKIMIGKLDELDDIEKELET